MTFERYSKKIRNNLRENTQQFTRKYATIYGKIRNNLRENTQQLRDRRNGVEISCILNVIFFKNKFTVGVCVFFYRSII